MGNELKDAMDDINARLTAVEKYFIDEEYLMRAEVRLWSNDEYYLAWGKLANRYCLIVAQMKDDDIVNQYPLKTASVEMRMRAIDQLDALEMALQDKLKEATTEMKQKAKKLDDWISRRKGI